MTAKRVTYRELRNTPGRVFERLAEGETLALVSEGEARALLIPVEEGELDTALDAWNRGRALIALGRLQASARRAGTAATPLSKINAEIGKARRARRATEREP